MSDQATQEEQDAPAITKRTPKGQRIPQSTLTEVIPMVEALANFNGAVSKKRVAGALNMTAGGGGFERKWASMGYYGFRKKSDDGREEITERGQALLSDDPGSVLQAKQHALVNTGFRAILDRFSTNPVNLPAIEGVLEEDLGVPQAQTKKIAEFLVKIAEDAELIIEQRFRVEPIMAAIEAVGEIAVTAAPKGASGGTGNTQRPNGASRSIQRPGAHPARADRAEDRGGGAGRPFRGGRRDQDRRPASHAPGDRRDRAPGAGGADPRCLTPAASATFEQVARAVRAASLDQPAERADELLVALGLLGPRGLTDTARTFEDAYWIYDDHETARAIWVRGLLGLPETQALMQGLHGRGPIKITGALHFMARHGFVSSADATAVRGLAQTLTSAGIAAYSNKHQTIRILAPLPEELAAVVRVVEPERPYSNVLALREILRACEGFIHWAEPHLPAKALEPLSYEADGTKITEIKLLSGAKSMTDGARKDFKRFAAEMGNRGITAEWRIIDPAKMDWHDRFILGRRQAWNVPPVNTLFKGDYSEASKTPTRPPFDRWWKLGESLAT